MTKKNVTEFNYNKLLKLIDKNYRKHPFHTYSIMIMVMIIMMMIMSSTEVMEAGEVEAGARAEDVEEVRGREEAPSPGKELR